MSKPTVPNSEALASAIKARRIKMNLTIESAAAKAGITSRTWSRYEEGKDIAASNVKKICTALNLKTLPVPVPIPRSTAKHTKSLKELWTADGSTWPSMMDSMFGTICAAAFSAGADLVIDDINDDLKELSGLPAGTHIGQLGCSMTDSMFPDQFLMHYTYDFLYKFKAAVRKLIYFWKGSCGDPRPQTPLEELAFYTMFERGVSFMVSAYEDSDYDPDATEIMDAVNKLLEESNKILEKSMAEADPEDDVSDDETAEHWCAYCDTIMGNCFRDTAHETDWLHEIFWDGELEEIATLLDNDHYVSEDSPYHFNNWEKSLYVKAPKNNKPAASIPVPKPASAEDDKADPAP